MIYVVRSNTGQFYRRGKLVRQHTAASCGHSPSGAAGILSRARAAFPELQWEAVPFRDAAQATTHLKGVPLRTEGGFAIPRPASATAADDAKRAETRDRFGEVLHPLDECRLHPGNRRSHCEHCEASQ